MRRMKERETEPNEMNGGKIRKMKGRETGGKEGGKIRRMKGGKRGRNEGKKDKKNEEKRKRVKRQTVR